MPAPLEIAVHSPFDGARVGAVRGYTEADAGRLLERAEHGARTARRLPRHARVAILRGAADLLDARAESFARTIVLEAGKTLRQARKEVTRCANTLRLSAIEAARGGGEVLPFDAYAGSEDRVGYFTREPMGVILAITPYNDPLNLAAHKVGPALAGGNAVILKPSELAPLSAQALTALLVEAGAPEDVVICAPGGQDLARALVRGAAVRMVSFTGGFRTGEAIAREAGLKKLAMDLGGNAPVLVFGDCRLEDAVRECVSGAFWAAGQNCIGVQRVFVERAVYGSFRDAMAAATRALRLGDPLLEATDVGPMITTEAAGRAEGLVTQALAGGARLLAGGARDGALFPPTVLEDAPHACAAWMEEAFAPIVTLEAFDDLDAVVAAANHPAFSLHAGLFTADVNLALELAQRLDAGGVMINDSSDYRFDGMPFGGFKYGSLGREGVRFAYEDMTQPKVVCFKRTPHARADGHSSNA